MSSTWTRRLGLTSLVIGFIWASTGCAQERDPINQVQSDALDKHFFVGASLSDTTDDPEFYMRTSVIDVPSQDTNGLHTAFDTQKLLRIKWDVQEDLLIARLTYEMIDNQDHHGSKTTNTGQIVGEWSITSHFDIRRSYNPQTGEEMNVITENSTDRPWYEREYMRVDWSKNLVTDAYSLDTLSGASFFGIKVDPESYFVSDPSDPNAPAFDTTDGYFDVTDKVLATPQSVNTPYGPIPSCYLTAPDWMSGDFIDNCNPTEVTLRLSFKKVVDHDYEPRDWDGTQMDAFGWFTQDRFGYDKNYGIVDDDWHRYASRYNIWDKSHVEGAQCAVDYWRDSSGAIAKYKVNPDGSFAVDPATGLPIPDPNGQPHPGSAVGSDPHADADANGTEDVCELHDAGGNLLHAGSRCDTFTHKCDLPLHERKTKTIPWYYGLNGTPDLFPSTARALNLWNAAILRAALIGQTVESDRVGGSFTLPTNPVTGAPFNLSTRDEVIADQALGNQGALPRIFTLCHNPSVETDDEACFRHDPDGNLVKGSDGKPVMVTARLGDLRYNIADQIPNEQAGGLWGIMVDGDDPLTGEKVVTSVNVWSAVTDLQAQSVEDMLKWIDGEISDSQIQSGQYLKNWMDASKLGSSQYQPTTMSHDDIVHAASKITNSTLFSASALPGTKGVLSPQASQTAGARKLAQKLGPSLDSKFEGDRTSLLGTTLEANLITPNQIQRSGHDPTAGLSDPTVAAAASPLQGLNPRLRRWARRMKDQAASYGGGCQIAAPEPDALVGLARQAQRLYPLPQNAPKDSPGYAGVNDPNYAALKAARDLALHQWLRDQFNVGVIAHEMGHSMGLRHNFAGSYDAMNYHTQYWQLRTRNGQEKACADPTVTHTDGNDCVGPRWIDPVSDAETNGLIWKWGSSTVMDYPGDSTQDMNDIGLYDEAAMRFGYADVVDVDQQKRLGAAKQIYLGRYDGFGGIVGPLDITGANSSGFTSAHYSQLNDLLDLVGKCSTPTDAGDVLTASCQGVPLGFVARRDMMATTNQLYSDAPTVNFAVDKQGRMRHPYMFGSDEYADTGNLPVFRFDAGADPYEQIQFLTSVYENRYVFSHFRRNRTTFSTDGVVGAIEARWFEKFSAATKGLALILQSDPANAAMYTDPVRGVGLLYPHVLASAVSLDEFAKVLTRPEPGNYVPGTNGGPMITSTDPRVSPMFQVTVGSGNGRYINNDYDYSKGYWWASYQSQVGSAYEKVDTVYYLTEAYNNFVQNSHAQFVDGRYLNINYATLYPDQMRRLFSALMQNDTSLFAPYAIVPPSNASATPAAAVSYLPWSSTSELSFPTNASPLDPAVGWEQQYPALIDSFIYGGTSLTMRWDDEMRVWSPGGGDTVSVPDAAKQYAYDDPMTGLEYLAIDYGDATIAGKTVKSTPGARMLQWAGDLARATYKTTSVGADGRVTYERDAHNRPVCAVDATTCANVEQQLTGYSANLDVLRQVVLHFGYGPLNRGE